MKDDFTIMVCSDLDYERPVADLFFKEHTVATITQDKGIDRMEIEIFPPPGEAALWRFPVDALLQAIKQAKKALAS